MLQNLKVDIIYYKTNTDFEMEFNLGGCCRMRLLTGKAQDKKTAVNCLARAVSRSKVIMVVGPLFGDNGTIKLVSTAIGSSVEPINKSAYNLNGGENVELIKDSTPLLTPEGYFGGCILENGPQTMIILSDSKSVRKSIMKNLIHPYMEELFASEHKEKFSIEDAAQKVALPLEDEAPDETVEADTDEAEEVEGVEDEEIIADNEENIPTEENVQESDGIDDALVIDIDKTNDVLIIDADETEENENEADIILSNDTIATYGGEDENQYMDLFLEPQKINSKKAKFLNEIYDDFESEEDNQINADIDEDYRYNRKSFDLPILIVAVALLILIALLCYCIFFVPTKYGVSSSEYINEIFTTLFG